MRFDRSNRNGAESSQADVQSETQNLGTAGFDRVEECGRKVERCRRSCNTPRNACEDGLISPLSVVGVIVNIGRKRHSSGAREERFERNGELQLDLAKPSF